MSEGQLVILEEDYVEVNEVIERLLDETGAKAGFLVHKCGQFITGAGEKGHFDTASLSSLIAGNMAAAGGLALLIGEKEFSVILHEGEKDCLHISRACDPAILVVLFDRNSSSGVVGSSAKRAVKDLAELFRQIADKSVKRANDSSPEQPLTDITDEDIDSLFT